MIEGSARGSKVGTRVLLVLLLGAVAFILWYVIDRRSRLRTDPPPRSVSPGP